MATKNPRRGTLLLVAALVFVPSFLPGGIGTVRPAAAGGCWANREALREERRRREEEWRLQELERLEREKQRRVDEISGGARTPPKSPTSGTPKSGGNLPTPGSGGSRPARRPAGPKSLRETWRGWWVVNDRALLPARVYRSGPVTTPSLLASALAR